MKKKYKIIFSIPVHERPDVVLDQIKNIIYNNPECAVVLHLSKEFNDNNSSISLESFFSSLDNYTNVYINPKRMRTDRIYIKGLYKLFRHMGWGDGIFFTHVSNFSYMKDIADFEFIMLLSSNELFIKRGAYEFIKKYIAGTQGYNRIIDVNTKWGTGRIAQQDKILKLLVKNISHREPYICGGQVEGSWYAKNIFSVICDNIISSYPKSKIFNKYYVREEIYYPTLLSHIVEVKENKVFCGNITNVLWENKDMRASVDDIKKTIESDNFFSIKRIERDINDPIRTYVRDVLCGNYKLNNE